ncbi:hypothetical protein [Spongiactinospora sp. 9N601]|uniref:hypothetical protein n=1 Tax=Spongiactinospora sp. 9N601 TaxID=3375149 RepID=UPI0037B1FD22
MSGARGGLEIVAAPAGGWCEPDTRVCHIVTADEAASAEADNEDAAGEMPGVPDVPDATRR